MLDSQANAMQCNSLASELFSTAIFPVANDGTINLGKLHANLMLAAGVQLNFNECALFVAL